MSGADLDRPAPANVFPRNAVRQDAPALVRDEAAARVPDPPAAGFAAALEAAREGLPETPEERRERTAAVFSNRPGESGERIGEGREEEESSPREHAAEAALPPAIRAGTPVHARSRAEAADLGTGELALGGVSAAGLRAAEPLSAPAPAGSTAPALEAAAIATLLGDLRALDAPPSGQWRFVMPGNVDGLSSLLLSRGESGAWNLRLGIDRGRGGVSRGELDSLRGALRERGHEIGGIVQGPDDGDESVA